ncbi:MAG: VOC family protein [Rhodospirillales bacterium]
MPRKIFVNLPVVDLDRSMSFFAAVGFSFNKQFTDATAACMVIDEHIYAMLLTRARAKDFTPKEIADATKTTEVLIALSADSRAEVDDLLDKALKAGGTATRPPADHGFMYERSFNDPDGHIWEIFWMDPAMIPQA